LNSLLLAPAWIERIGFVAAVCTTTASVPPWLRVITVKSACDVSLDPILLFSQGVFLRLVCGISAGSKPVIASNGATLILPVSVLSPKIKYDRSAIKELKL
jgi:MtN3 and saliva related transmembrane protein